MSDRVFGSELLRLVEVMDKLRSPGGCAWDAEQTHESLIKYLLEESYEFIDAIETEDRVGMREELGDVLLQVYFHSRIAQDHPTDPFTIDDVAGAIADKLIGRQDLNLRLIKNAVMSKTIAVTPRNPRSSINIIKVGVLPGVTSRKSRL